MRHACSVWNPEGMIFKAAALRLPATDLNHPRITYVSIVELADKNRSAGTDHFIVDSMVGSCQYGIER